MWDLPKDFWLAILGLAGGIGAVALNIQTVGPEYWKSPDFWRVLVLDLLVVIMVGVPVAWLAGDYVGALGYDKAMYFVAYLSAVVSKDVVKQAGAEMLPRLIAIIARKP